MAVSLGSLLSGETYNAIVTTSGNDIYVFYATTTDLYIQKSTNGGSSFSPLDTVSGSTMFGVSGVNFNSFSVAIDSSDYIHTIAEAADGVSGSCVVYARLNTSDDSWDTWEEAMAYVDNTTFTDAADIAIDSTDSPHIVATQNEAYHGTGYNQIYYANKTGASWSAPEKVNVTQNTNYFLPTIVVRGSDVIEVIYQPSAPNVAFPTIRRTRTGGSWGSESQWSTSVRTSQSQSMLATSGGTVYVYGAASSGLYENDALIIDPDNGYTQYYDIAVTLYSGTRYIIFVQGSTGTSLAYMSNDGGGWSGSTLLDSGTGFNAVYSEWAYNAENQSNRINYTYHSGGNRMFDYLDLGGATTVYASDSVNVQTSDNIDLIQNYSLSVDDAVQAQVADNITLTYTPPATPVLAKVGSFLIDHTKGIAAIQSVSGVGFQPKIVLLWWDGSITTSGCVTGGDHYFGIGAMDENGGQFAVAGVSQDNLGTSAAYSGQYTQNCIRVYTAPATAEGYYTFSSMDSDGFSMEVVNSFDNDYLVNYLALGGDSITNVFAGSALTTGTAGEYDITGVGFQPDAALFTGYASSGNNTGSVNQYIFLGMASGSSQGVVNAHALDALATTHTRGYSYDGEVVASREVDGTDAYMSFNSDGIHMNHGLGSARTIYIFCLQGDYFKVGNFSTRTDSNDISIEIGFNPAAILFASTNRALSTQDTPTADAKLSIGAATSATERGVQAISDVDNVATTEVARADYDNAVYLNISSDAIVGAMDIKSIDTTGFTCVMDDTDPAASWVTYLAIGPASTGGPTTLAIDDAVQLQTSTEPALNGTYVLTVNDASQIQSADNLNISGIPTLFLVAGFEPGVFSTNGGGLVFQTAGGGMSVSGSFAHSGNYSLRGIGDGGETTATWNLTDNNSEIVVSFYFLWHVLPNVETTIFRVYWDVLGTARVNFDPADQKIFGRYTTLGTKVDKVLAQDTWYKIDVKVWYSGGTKYMSYDVDETGAQTATITESGNFIDGLVFGCIESTPTISQGEFYWDDVVASYALGDFHIGAHRVLPLLPSSDGTHNNGANILEDQDGNDIDGSTYMAYNKLNEYPWTDTISGSYIRQANTGGTNYVEINFEDTVESEIWAVRGILQYGASGTTANNGTTYIEGDAEDTLYSGDMSETSPFYKEAIATTPAGGWTTAKVNALKARMGYSTDVTTNPYWLATMLEVVVAGEGSQAYQLVVNDAVQAQTGDNISLSQNYVLGVQDAQQAQTSDNISLAQNYNLSIQDAQQAQVSDNVSLTQNYSLSINDAQQLQVADNIILTQNYNLSVIDAAQIQSVDNISLIQNYALSVDDAQQIQAIDNISLAQGYSLTVGDVQQIQTADNVSLSQNYNLTVADAIQLQVSDNISLVQNYSLIVQDSAQIQTSDTINLSQNYLLVAQDSAQIQTVDNVNLSQGGELAVQDSAQLQTSDDIVLIQNYILSVQDAQQVQISDNIILIPYQGVIIDIDHETGDFSQYTGTIATGSVVTIEQAAALMNTTYGMQCNVLDTASKYALKRLDVIAKSNIFHARFYIDINSLPMVPGDAIVPITTKNSAGIQLAYVPFFPSGDGYSTRISLFDDAGAQFASPNVNISDATHLIEVEVVRASGSATNDGYGRIWIDNFYSGSTIVPCDNYDKFYDLWEVDFGIEYVNPTATYTGIYYIDELIVNDTGEMIGGAHVLTVDDAIQTQTADNISLAQNYTLSVDDSIQAQSVDNINLTQNYLLSVDNNIQIQTTDDISLTQNYLLTVQDAQQSQTSDNIILTYYPPTGQLAVQNAQQIQIADNIDLIQNYLLIINDAIQLQISDNISLAQNYILTIDNAQQAQTSDNILLTQNYALMVNNAAQLQVADNVALTQHYVLSANDSIQSQTADEISLAQNYILAVDDTVQAQTSDNIDLVQHQYGALTMNDALQAQVVDTPTLTQNYLLVVQDAIQTQVADNITITYNPSTVSLTVDDTVQKQLAIEVVAVASDYVLTNQYFGERGMPADYFPYEFSANLTLTAHLPTEGLTVNNAIQAQIVDSPTLAQNYVLDVQDSVQVQTADNIFLTQNYILDIQDTAQVQIVDNIVLTQNYTLGIQDVIQIQTTDDINLSQGYNLVIDDSQQVQTSDEITLTQNYLLSVSDGVQAQISDSIALSQGYVLNSNDTQQNQTADNIVLTQNYLLVIQDATQLQTSDIVSLAQNYILPISDVVQIQTSDNISLAQNYILAVNDAVQIQTSENVELVQHQYGWATPDNAIQVQTSDNVPLIQHYVLAINDAVQLQTSDNISLSAIFTLTVDDAQQSQTALEYVTSPSDYILSNQYFAQDAMPDWYFPLDISRNLTLIYHKPISGITIQDASQSQTVDSVILIQNYLLVVNDAVQTQISDIIDLIQHYILPANDAAQIQTADNIDLIQHQYGALNVDNAIQAQTSEELILAQNYILSVDNAIQTQTANNISLSQIIPISVANTQQLQTSDVLELIQNYLLSVDDSIQVQTSDNVTLIQHLVGAVTVDNAAQVQSADNIDLIQHHVLEIQDAIQVQTPDHIYLGQNYTLEMQDAVQAQTAEKVDLSATYLAIANDAIQAQTSDNVTLLAHYTLNINDAVQAQTSDEITLFAHYILSGIQDASQIQTAEEPTLIYHNVLAVDDAVQLQTVDNIILTAHIPEFVLSVADATQIQTSDRLVLVYVPLYIFSSTLERTYFILSENRAYYVDYDNRDYTIIHENRNLYMENEDRNFRIENDNRTLKIE